MDQRAREFWLEMKHLGDWQRIRGDAVRRRGGNALLQARAGSVRFGDVFADSDLGDHGQPQFPEDIRFLLSS